MSGVDYTRRQKIRLRVRVEDANLATEERGLRLNAWSSVWRTDPGKSAQASIPLPLDDKNNSHPVDINLVVPAGMGGNDHRWPADATLWFGAHAYAPSEVGPLVGGRAGCGGVRFSDLQDRLSSEKPDPILIKLRMSQPGVPKEEGEGRYRKMNVRILTFASEASRTAVRGWACEKSVGPFDFVKSKMPLHEKLLSEYVNVALFPYTDIAKAQNLFFRPSHSAVEPIHAPLWMDNVVAPGFAFWTQTGVPFYNEAMTSFMMTASSTVLERHDWPKGIPELHVASGTFVNKPAWRAFVDVVNGQFQRTDPNDTNYSDAFTYAVAALMDTCSLLAVSTFYRYDEVYRVDQHWFRQPTVKKAQTESFQDALAMTGGDCEDVGSLIHRVFRWLQLGDPKHASTDKRIYWRAYGGWEDPVLDAMQHIAYWYVSGGGLGSVTAARFKPQPGHVAQLLIRSDEDESLPVGGHMWQEALPVTKMETLLRRMNKSGVGPLRPEYIRDIGRYPGWIKGLPHTVGEGTGSVYPLVLPLIEYMHSEPGRRSAFEKHRNMISALKRVQHKTSVLARIQVERWSDRATPVADARVNYFYRRTTKFSTDDLALHGIPRFDFIWTRKRRRVSEAHQESEGTVARISAQALAFSSGDDCGRVIKTKGRNKTTKQISVGTHDGDTSEGTSEGTSDYTSEDEDVLFFMGKTRDFIDVPGEGDLDSRTPSWGVDMRDKIMTANLAVEGGRMHRSVALVAAPPVTNDEMRSFMSRIAQLAPWQQPRRSPRAMKGVQDLLGDAVASFQANAERLVRQQLERTGPSAETSTRVNIIFRRDQFLIPKMQELALQDIGRLEGDIERVETSVEFLDDSVYNVRLSLWLFDVGVMPEEDVLHPVEPIKT